MMIFLFIGYGFLGLVLPTTAILSLENHGAIAGTASALIGALQFGVGAAVMAVSGVFADGAPKPMVIGIAISAVIAFAIARFTLSTENSRLPILTHPDPSRPGGTIRKKEFRVRRLAPADRLL